MDADRFDALSRALTCARSRRVTLGALLGVLLGRALPGPSPDARAAARKGNKGIGKTKQPGHSSPQHDRHSGRGATNRDRSQHGTDRHAAHTEELPDAQFMTPTDDPPAEPTNGLAVPEHNEADRAVQSERREVTTVEVSTAACLPAGAKPCRKGSDCCSGLCNKKKRKCRPCTVCQSGCPFTTIQEAVFAAKSGGTVTVAPGIYQEVHPADNEYGRGLMPPAKPLTLRRCGETGEVVLRNANPNGFSAAMTVTGLGDVTVEDFVFTRNPAFERGIGIYNWGRLTLVNCTVRGCFNQTNTTGGGIFNQGNLVMRGGAVTENTTHSDGPGIHNDGTQTSLEPDFGKVTLIGVELSHNVSDSAGGGYYDSDSRVGVTLTDCTVKDNIAGSGGGIYSRASSLHLTNTTVSGNTALFAGGIFYGGPDLLLEDSTVTGNAGSPDYCGGVCLDWWGAPGSFILSGTTTITDNTPSNCVSASPVEWCVA